MYFLEKNGVYSHGVFWIGDNVEEGISEAVKAASLDVDRHHSWNVVKFIKPCDYEEDGVSDVIFSIRKPNCIELQSGFIERGFHDYNRKTGRVIKLVGVFPFLKYIKD